jgi:exodeoxyribonuclease VII large subunit
LRKGYSLTYINGKLIKNSSGIRKGDVFNTRFYDGELTGKVESVKKKSNKQNKK